MSYLSLPRVHFVGTASTTPPTTNNNNYNLVLDPENVSFFPPYDPAHMNDAKFRDNMRTLAEKSFSPFPMPDAKVLNGNWNYYGDNGFYFKNAQIYAVEMAGPNGVERITSAEQDGLIGAAVNLLGNQMGDQDTPTMMVDCDPSGNFSTQLFSGKFVFGGTGCGCTAMSTDTVPLPRAYTRWLDLARNLAAMPDACFGTIWLQPLPNATLSFDTSANRSPVLALLQKLSASGAGLVVRFTNYYFQRKYTDPELYELFQKGDYAMNESWGILVGTIGFWGADEPGTYTPGRMLRPNTTPLCYTVSGRSKPAKFTLASAAAMVDRSRKVVVLDLAMAFPEVNLPQQTQPLPPPDPSLFEKIDLGVATLQVLNGDGTITDIGTFDYDTTTYLATAGIVEVPYSAQQEAAILAGSLQVNCSAASTDCSATSNGNPVLVEKVYMADAEEHCIYVTEGETVTVQIRVTERGSQPTEPVPVTIDQYRGVEKAQSDPVKDIPLKYMYLVAGSQPPVPPFVTVTPSTLKVDGNGMATITIKGLCPGIGFLRFMAGPASDNPVPVIGPDMQTWMRQMPWAFFAYVRVLPADSELANLPDSEITWDCVYKNVLQYYYRLYPAMDQYLMLNDPNDAGSANGRAIIKARTAKALWHSTLYMPHTRELSDGKRILLQRWCDKPPGT
jgi:hypothetical protein